MATLKHPLLAGESVYLTPNTLGAPTAAWRQPKCVVVRVAQTQVTVRLDDGTEVTTHQNNVVRRLPNRIRRRLTKPAARPPMVGGAEEIPLF